MRTRLPLTSLPGTSAFTRAYIADFARVQPWFDYDPSAPDAIARRLAELDAREWPDLSVSAALAAAQQELWGAGPEAVEAAQALGQPGTCMVVTGQQPGLFGGPLYSPLKALTAVRTAQQLAAQFPQRRFVPVFWIAGADSDFDEVNHTWVLGADAAPTELRLRDPGRHDGQALYSRAVPEPRWAAAWAELEQALPPGLYREDALAALQAAYPPEDRSAPGGMVRGFARWLARLFRGTGLVVLDPEELLARADIGALYAAQLRAAGAAGTALEQRNAQIAAAGFSPQVEALPGDAQVFHVDADGHRDKLLLAEDGSLTGKRSGRRWSAAELAALAEAAPQRFTGSALFRPLVEDSLFPCAAWVGGQAELAYRAQATALFVLHGLRQAPAYLRHHATLLTPQAAAALDSAGVELSALPADAHAWARELAQRAAPEPVRAALEEYHALARQADDRLADAVEAGLPELERSLRTMRGKLEWHLARVERKVLAALNRRGAQRTQALLAAQRLAFPLGRPQERVLGLLAWLPRTGLSVVPRLLAGLEAPCWEHCLIMLD
jgi:bacillithiol biosynthesis cysteine-adding enzyme BshC